MNRFGGGAADVFVAIAAGFALYGIANALLLASAMRDRLSPRPTWRRADKEVAG
jgi:hypothetical protein